MADQARGLPRAQRSFFVFMTDSELVPMRGPGGMVEVHPHDIQDLSMVGALLQRSETEYTLLPEAYNLLQREADAAPVAQIEDEVTHRFLDGEELRTAYPEAHARWHEAAVLLWGENAATELTTIGHKLREATQEFASVLVEVHTPPDVDPDPAHTAARLRAVLDAQRDRLGEARHDLLTALVSYWGEVSDLLQRQEHGGQKEGEPLTWEDGRRAVFQTAIVMFEVHRTL